MGISSENLLSSSINKKMRIIHRSIIAGLLALTALGLSSCGSSKPAPRPSYSAPRKVVFKPLVTIRNNSYKSILLGLRGPETRFVSIPARSSRSVNLYSGTYNYAATAKNTNTISGYKYFGTNRKYTWNFKVN